MGYYIIHGIGPKLTLSSPKYEHCMMTPFEDFFMLSENRCINDHTKVRRLKDFLSYY